MANVARQFIEFFERAVEDRGATVEAGAPKFKDEHFVRIHNPGGKDVFEKEVDNFLKDSRDEEMKAKVRRGYEDWKGKRDPEVDGIRLKDIPLLTAAECKNLADVKIFTVEELAAVDENGLKAIGMGGRNLKKKASDYLKGANDVGKLVQKLSTMSEDYKNMEDRLKELEETNALLKADKQDGKLTKKTKEAA